MTCRNLRTGKRLFSFRTKAIAKKAEKAAKKRGHRLIAYQCHNCENWHLAPRKHHRIDCIAGCVDRKGVPKKEYLSKADAELTASLIVNQQGTKLWVYECPHQEGVWHITSRDQDQKKRKGKKKARRTRGGRTRRQ